MMLSGLEKAAFLLLSLDEEQAAPLLARLPDETLRRLRQTADGLSQKNQRVTPDMMVGVYDEFVRSVNGDQPMLRLGNDYLSTLYRRAVGDERAHLLLHEQPPPGGPLDGVTSDGKVLAEVLANEHPQTIAAVLSQVSTQVASLVLTSLPEEIQEDVVDRMATLVSISEEAIHATRDTLATELGEDLVVNGAAGVGRIAAILNVLLPEQSAALLAKIEQRSPERAALIRREQFTFDDLSKLDRRGMQVLLREVEANVLVVALKTAGQEVRERVFSSMSSRAAETIKEDLTNLGPQRLSDVEKAQRDIIEAALRLQTEGKLVLATGGQVV